MSRIKQLCGGVAVALVSIAAVPAVQAQDGAVTAVARFVPAMETQARVEAVEDAGGRVVRVRPRAVVARMAAPDADALRSAQGVVSVTIRR